KLMLAEVYKCKLHLARNFNVHLARDANAPRLRNRFEASSNVDAIAVDAGVVENNVTLIDPNAEVHARVPSTPALRPAIVLDCHRALACIQDAAEHCEDPIAGRVNGAAPVLCDHGEYDGLMRLEVANRAGFVRTHEGAVTSDICRKNCCEPTLLPLSHRSGLSRINYSVGLPYSR